MNEVLESFSEKSEDSLDNLNVVIADAIRDEKDLWDMVSYDTLFIAFVTILIFGLGFVINHFYTKWLKWKEAKSVRNAFSTWLFLHEKIFENQKENLNEFLEKLKSSGEIHVERLLVKNIQMQKLLEIPFLKLMNIYVTNSKGSSVDNEKAFFNLVNTLEFLSHINRKIFEDYKKFEEGTEVLQNEWNVAFSDFDETRVTFIRGFAETENSPKKDFALQLNAFTSEFLTSSSGNINAEKWINEYFFPLKNMVNEIMAKNLQFSEIQEIASKIENLLVINKRWDAWKSGYIKIFEDLRDNSDSNFKVAWNQIRHFSISDIKFWMSFTHLD